jgi:hypothetical protein
MRYQMIRALYDQMKSRFGPQFLDFLSMGLSGLCLVHCLALPVIVALLPALGGLAREDWVHKVLILIAAPMTGFTLYRTGGWKRWNVLGFAAFGLALLALAAFNRDLEPVEVAFSVVGAVYVAMAHLINYWDHEDRHARQNCACPA